MGNSNRSWRTLFWPALLIIPIGWGGLVYFRGHGDGGAPVVETEKVLRRTISEVVVGNGRIHPVKEVKISPEVSGEIIALPIAEGQTVHKGDLLLRIRPDFYEANRKSAQANYEVAVAAKNLADASLKKADAEFVRAQELIRNKLVSDASFLETKTEYEIAKSQAETAAYQIEVARAALARADEELAKTTIVSPTDGTISRLNSELGERVVGTATMAGTEVMVIADLNEMDAVVDVSEADVVLLKRGQAARLKVDAFRGKKYRGQVTAIASAAKVPTAGGASASGSPLEAVRFEVRIRVLDREDFRPGMSVTAEIETRSRTNVVAVPIQSVTTRVPARTGVVGGAPGAPAEVVFLVDNGVVHMVPVHRGISDDAYVELLGADLEGRLVVTGDYKAIQRELQDGQRVHLGP